MTITDFINQFTFPHECVYDPGHYGDPAFVISENVSGDNGGVTKFGIDAESHPGIDVGDLDADQATQIYIAEFMAIKWRDGSGLAAMPDFPGNTGFAFFDAREVCGEKEAWLFAQRALGIQDDGIPGEGTRAAVISASPATFASTMIQERRKFHRWLAANRGHDAQFLQGWLNRCDDLEKYLLS